MAHDNDGLPVKVADPEKAPPAYSNDSSSGNAPAPVVYGRDVEDFWTRNGLNLASFQKRRYAEGETPQLDRSMKKRHLHMIAIGGSIGAGFFVGSGAALAEGGPASLVIDFGIIGIMMFNVVFALGELAVMYPVSGGFYTYSTRFIDPSWGFAMGWNYVLQWAVVLPFELVTASITIGYWDVDQKISHGVWITVFMVVIIAINVFGTLGYAEEEFISSFLKLTATVIFMIMALIFVCGGGPSDGRYNEYWGARYWYDPGAFQNGFFGFCSVFVTAAFAYSGTELVGLAAAEARNPVKELPGAIKQVFWRISLFYILGLFFVGLLISSKDDNLLNTSKAGANTSPFVLVAKYAGLPGFAHFLNAIILISVISIGVSGVYGGSRTLVALAEQGYAPKLFTYIDRAGRPLFAVGFIIVFSPLAYVNLSSAGNTIFDWLLALSGLAALFTWSSICLAHIRYRLAWTKQGRSMDMIPFKAAGGIYGSILGLTLNILVLIATFYTAVKDGNAETFFKNYLAAPVVIVFWIGGFFWKGGPWVTLDQLDLDTGLREHNWDEINEYRAKIAALPKWRRILKKLF
ncbi:hypothetical protein TD95_004950 [Thielaviopsis punctulata]|uniref:Amino acid permease/ SLC12A domain-containing protein n=1 Tax=Thielaviopsis punctulata TaxID=72032 RepID=A0A0F4ZKG7_9PEZI|nr:hypothetical protein TD95_004950 [Thielaviopsis punctulata]